MTSSRPRSRDTAPPAGRRRRLDDAISAAPRFPVLRETVEALDALRANEERTDANSIGEMIGGDPAHDAESARVRVRAPRPQRGHRAETVISALVMMGIPPFFRAFAAADAVEDRLAGFAGGARPACSACCGGRIAARRSRSASRSIAPIRTRPPSTPPPCCTNSPRLLLWCHAPSCAFRIRAMQDADPTLRSSVAQRSVLHIELDELQQALVAAWRLPSLLARDDGRSAGDGQTGAREVALGARLARHTARGWDNAAVPDDIAEIAAFLNLSPAATLKLLMEIDAASASARRGVGPERAQAVTSAPTGPITLSRRGRAALPRTRRDDRPSARAASAPGDGCRRRAASHCGSGRRCCRNGSRSR